MGFTNHLVFFGLRQVFGESADEAGRTLRNYFQDASQRLPKAVKQANEKAWQAVELALLGDTVLGKMKHYFNTAELRSLTQCIDDLVSQKGTDFRKACLKELKEAKAKGLLELELPSAEDAKSIASRFQRYQSPEALIDAGWEAAHRFADELQRRGMSHLEALLRHQTGGEAPLWLSAFGYFLRREIIDEPELRDELYCDSLWRIGKDQRAGFDAVQAAITDMGDRFQITLDKGFHDLFELGTQIHEDVLDVKQLVLQVQSVLSNHRAISGEMNPNLSCSIHSLEEKLLVKQILERYRQLPEEQRRDPELMNGIGKLEVGVGMLKEGEETFRELEQSTTDVSQKGEALYNAYQTALEQQKWKEALDYYQQAVQYNAERFSCFPQKYPPARILGAGGFGVVFLCQHRFMGWKRAIKAYFSNDRSIQFEHVFKEATTLSGLKHPAFVEVHDCGFADSAEKRPFMVMEYFNGVPLEDYIKQNGCLSPKEAIPLARMIAEAMKVAHEREILHRDLKPANILVHREKHEWRIKIIDFGLALDLNVYRKEMAAATQGKTILGSSVAGTYKFAPPEQTGELPGVKTDCYSDIFSYAKTLNYVLFGTPRITMANYKRIGLDHPLSELIDACVQENPADRPKSFSEVLTFLVESPKQEKVEIVREEPEKRKPKKIHRPKLITIPIPNLPKGAKPLEMLLIPAGEFWMGSPDNEKDRYTAEGPQHKVTINYEFYMGKYPITQAQWQAVMGNNPSWFKDNPDHPVEGVSWNDCQVFLEKLNEMEAVEGLRLPSEAEWEYAYRAGTQTRFYWGDDLMEKEIDNYAWYDKNSKFSTEAVGQKKPNQFGLYDMSGNVYEWCEDDWHGNYEGAPADGSAWVDDPRGSGRVNRGGGWLNGAQYCRSAYRYDYSPDGTFGNIGFRPLRSYP